MPKSFDNLGAERNHPETTTASIKLEIWEEQLLQTEKLDRHAAIPTKTSTEPLTQQTMGTEF